MLIALVSVLGIALGAILQYAFTRVLEERRHMRELRTQAYADYLESVAEMKFLLIQAGTREQELLARLTNANVRVGLYGTEAVVRRLATFERLGGGNLRSEEQKAAFVEVIAAMRAGGDLKDDLQQIILGDERSAKHSASA